MSPILSADNRNAAFDHSLADTRSFRTTPTIRLLEVTGALNRHQVDSLPAAPAHSHRPTFPDRPSALNASQAFGVVTCGLLLSAIVAALIISLG